MWCEISFSREAIKSDHHLKLIEMMRNIWERKGRPDDFALLGTHKFGTGNDKITVYYLTPTAKEHCSDSVLTVWQVTFMRDKKPSGESLEVVAGDKRALRLLD